MLFNRCVLYFLFVHLFVLKISVTSLMSFQREGTNDFARPSERHDVEIRGMGPFINETDFKHNKLLSICHSRKAKYFFSMEVREFKNSIGL